MGIRQTYDFIARDMIEDGRVVSAPMVPVSSGGLPGQRSTTSGLSAATAGAVPTSMTNNQWAVGLRMVRDGRFGLVTYGLSLSRLASCRAAPTIQAICSASKADEWVGRAAFTQS